MKCAIYTRVSTDNQAEKEFNSCEAQEEKIISYIKSQEDMTLYRVYTDPGFSGASLERPAMQEMLADLAVGKIDCILTYKIDRLTRSPRDFYYLIDIFDNHNAVFISITEHFDTASPSGRLLRNIMLTFAQFEREMTAERTRDKMAQRAQKGMWNGGVVPFGYRNVDKKLRIDETEAACVKEIYRIFLESMSLSETRRQINRKYRTRAGKEFCKGSIDNILRNPLYYGKIFYKGNLYKGIHKPIITEAEFLKAQSIRKVRPLKETKINRPYLLTGLIRCKECGSVMTPTYTQNRHRHSKGSRFTYYYRCTKTYKHNWNSCSVKSVNADKIEDFIISGLKEISQNEEKINSLVKRINQDQEQRLSPLKRQETKLINEMKEAERKIKNLVNFLSDGEAVKYPSVKKELVTLENTKKIKEFDLEGVRLVIHKQEQDSIEAKSVLDTLRDFNRRLEIIEPRDRTYLFQSLIKSIDYGRDEIAVDIFYLPKGYLPNSAQEQKKTGMLTASKCSKNRPEMLP